MMSPEVSGSTAATRATVVDSHQMVTIVYAARLKVAETLQRSLLTPPPRTDDLDIAVRYRPASRHTLVGGDFYDAFLLPIPRYMVVFSAYMRRVGA